MHKNHIIILQSLKHIKEKYKFNKLLVVSTGYSKDHRNYNCFYQIKRFIIENNLQDNYKYLGIIPFIEVLSLKYHSIAVINPSKFEGRSSTVEQAKSMGKQVILSNINTHREQNPTRGIYFNPDNFLELSSIMIKVWNKYNYSNNKKFINKAYKQNRESLLKYYSDYQKIIRSVI